MSAAPGSRRFWAWIIGAIGGIGFGVAISFPLDNLVVGLIFGGVIGVMFAIAFGAFGYGAPRRSHGTDASTGIFGAGAVGHDGKGDGFGGDGGAGGGGDGGGSSG